MRLYGFFLFFQLLSQLTITLLQMVRYFLDCIQIKVTSSHDIPTVTKRKHTSLDDDHVPLFISNTLWEMK